MTFGATCGEATLTDTEGNATSDYNLKHCL